ncbi:MAG: glycerophosphodiester phosphodiesterase family protein, partial [Myxococcales bacterium]|nr:glycerophosphodiester phosphodiesterase family protein [Myxococcales bacterium]
DAAPDGPPVDSAPPEAGPDDAGADATPADEGPPDGAVVDAYEPPPLPFVPGPPAELFDCNAEFVDPGRRSPVPLDCVIDPACDARMVVGHRGAGGQAGTIAPENSLAGIRAALLMGVDGVELDVRHTADDHLVLMHDGSVDRTTDGEGNVDQMTLAEVTALHLKRPYHPDVPGDFDCETVPTLEQAFALTGGRVFIDLDTKTDRVDLVVAAIAAAGLHDEVFVSVSGVDRAVQARALDPEVRVQIRPDTPEEYASAMALFARAPEVIEIPDVRVAEMAPSIREAGLKVFADVFGIDAAALLLGDLQRYVGRYDAGAHILQSEYPPLVLEALGRRDF